MSTPEPNTTLTQDELKALVGQAALQYLVRGEIVGVGTGSAHSWWSLRCSLCGATWQSS